MNKHKLLFVPVLANLFWGYSLFAQKNSGPPGMEEWEPNLNYFTDRTPVINDDLLKYSNPSVFTHPEFGVLPEDAPCADCVELIDKRTENSRYFIKNNTRGTEFYKQTSFGDLHFKDEFGRYITYDRRLQHISNGLYEAKNQATPTLIDFDNKISGFIVGGEKFAFNNNLKLLHIKSTGEEEVLALADWSQKTVGDHGAYITDVWPGIDMKIAVDLNMIKTNFIIKNPIYLEDGYLAISDNLLLPENFNVGRGEGQEGLLGWNGTYIAASKTDETYGFEIGRAIAMDSKKFLTRDSVGIHGYNPEYLYDSVAHDLKIILSAEWLNNPELVYPVIVDPLVTSSATYATLMKFRYNGEFCGGATYCSYTLNVALPANCTVTGATFTAVYITTPGSCAPFSCIMGDAGFRIWSDSCDEFSPSDVPTPLWWTCNLVAIGTCSGAGLDITSLVSCLTPKCSGTIPFEMRNSYCFCNVNGDCVSGTPCQKMNANTWSVTISGHTVEATALAAGATTYTVVDCSDQSDWLTPAYPIYGVPGYTYSWSPIGSVEDSVYEIFPLGTTSYTLTITDACGNTATDVVTVINDCIILPINLISFSGYNLEGSNYLNWEIASAENNKPFIIERSYNGVNFEEIGYVATENISNGNTHFSFIDSSPFKSFNYYRLKQLALDGSIAYSKIIVIKTTENYIPDIVVNSENTIDHSIDLTIISGSDGFGDIDIRDISGNLIYRKRVPVSKGATSLLLFLPEIAHGIYIISFSTETEFTLTKFLH